jgi:alpha-glucosidase
MRIRLFSSTIIAIALFSAALHAQKTPPDAEGHAWWQHAVFYELYPRSFADSNNDGTGDIPGITAKLDYLKDLGVDAIWITPCFPSPQVDFGYDVSDYDNIDPRYGTLADFDRLVAEGKKRNIRIILDFVVNHTSDKHPWFVDSRSSRTAQHRDWYVWRDGRAAGQPPNNWLSTFGHSAWQFDPKTKQYYYHYFYIQQPDLNWRNPVVEKTMLDVPRFWYQRGVAGFRLDAVDTLFEDPKLPDNPVLPGKNKYGDPNMENKYDTKLPEVHDVLRKLRTQANDYDAVLIGETWTKDIDELKQFYGDHSNELQMPMDFLFTQVNKLSAPEFRRQIAGVDAANGWPVFLFSNHDIRRQLNRYGDGTDDQQIAKLLAGLYLTLRGTPIMYYGEEIGMVNNDPKRRQDVQDPIGRTGWPQEIGRDGERTPMQWNEAANAGFTQGKPWLPVPSSYKTANVASELKDPNSVLNFYKRVLAIRHSNEAVREGKYVPLNPDDDHVLSYLRQYKNAAVLVALNMSSTPQKVAFDLAPQGFASATLRPLLATDGAGQPGSAASLELQPFGVYIAEVQSGPGAGQSGR